MPWVAAAVGAIAGGQRDRVKNVSGASYSDNIRLQDFEDLNKGRSELEALGYNAQVSNFQDLMKLLQFGPGQSEIQANTQYQNQFANQLQGLLGRSLNPTQANIQEDYGVSQQLFAPQQVALNQQFQDQATASNRLAARLGRAGNDPVLRNKLMQEQTRQQSMLNAEIGSYARQLPDIQATRALNLGGALSQIRGGLASQALQNRQTLLSLGNELANSERNYRLQAAGRYGTRESDSAQYSGGGIKGALQGGAQGYFGGFSSFAQGFGNGQAQR